MRLGGWFRADLYWAILQIIFWLLHQLQMDIRSLVSQSGTELKPRGALHLES